MRTFYAWLIANVESVTTFLVVAVMAALFTYRNMGEVVSHRIICHNSRVSLFEFTWMYTFNRFVAVLSGLSSLGLFVFVGRLLVGKVME